MKKYFKALFLSFVCVLFFCCSVQGEECGSNSNSGINYADKNSWTYWNEGYRKADCFFVAPSVIVSDKCTNADINDEDFRRKFLGASNMELGLYNERCTIYAPYYRQVSLPVYYMEDNEEYFEQAYKDVKDAFIYYIEHCDNSKPLIMAGFSQGSEMILRLLEEFFAEKKLQKRFAAAYLIGWRVTEEDLALYPHLKMAESKDDVGVIVCFNSEAENIDDSLFIPSGMKSFAVNPLSWKTSCEHADKSLNKGACFTDYSGSIVKEIPAFTGCYIDKKRGSLKVTDVDRDKYPGVIMPDGIYHIYDYMFFFRNIQRNVCDRLDAFSRKSENAEE